MKRTFALLLAALAAAAVLGGLVHAVLVAAHLSEPAATTVYGPTLRRLWATSAVALALVGLVIGGLGPTRPARRFRAAPRGIGGVRGPGAGRLPRAERGVQIGHSRARRRARQREPPTAP